MVNMFIIGYLGFWRCIGLASPSTWPRPPGPGPGPGNFSLLAAPLTTGLMTTGQLCVTTTFTIKLLFLVSSRCNILCLSKEILKVWICRREDPVFESWHCHIWKQKSNNKVMHINSHILEWTMCFQFLSNLISHKFYINPVLIVTL